MNIIEKRTIELTTDEQEQITTLFNKVFSKNETPQEFIQKYFWTDPKGAFHALLKDGEKIVGCYCGIPYPYHYFGKLLTFGLCVDTMLDEAYRGNPFTLKKMALPVYEALRQHNVSFVFGFPNENAYLLQKKILKFDDIGLQDFYMLPIRIGNIKPSLKFANLASKLLAHLMVGYTQLIPAKLTQPTYNIQLADLDDTFIAKRYAKDYQIVTHHNGYYVYKIYPEDAATVAYLIEVQPLTQSLVEQAVTEIYHREKSIDAIMFVGKLPFRTRNLIKVPQKYLPKPVRMIGKILDNTSVDANVFNLANWKVGIGNYDVR